MQKVAAYIQPFENAHLDAVVSLSLRAWAPVFVGMGEAMLPAVFNAFYPDGWEARQRKDVQAVCHDPGIGVWVALIAGEVAGFVAVRFHEEDPMGEIYMIAVDPGHQRAGIGSSLAAFALARMREAGLSIAMIETGGDPGHAPARSAYEKSGFTALPVMRYFREL